MNQEDVWYRDDDQSLLKIHDIRTCKSETVHFYDYLIEAPNWTPDGKALVFNSNGQIWRFDLESGETALIDTGYADNCNNDHVLSPDGTMVAVSHGTREDGKSRIYIAPMSGGTPRLITPLGPSYLHGWSPDGKSWHQHRRGNQNPG